RKMPEYCVTGGTGFIASYLIRELLSRGHTVRATARDPGIQLAHCLEGLDKALYVSLRDRVVPSEDVAKVGFLWSMGGAKERLKLVKADLLVDGSFDLAVDGVDGVFHTASPVFVPQDQNVQVNAPTLNSVVVPLLLIVICDISKWQLWYAYAKTLAEKEAWRFAEHFGINLVVVNPSFVVGPLIAPRPTSTLLLVLSILKGKCTYVPISCSESQTLDKCNDQEGDSNPHSMDTAKIRELGLPCFKTLPQMFNDCIKSFRDKGLL
ncbi:hypothetical protein B296_00013864, partial [Ensete ventricosum]